MDFPHRFRPARFHSDARARLAARGYTSAGTLSVGRAPPDRRRSPSASWMDPWGRTASAGSSPRAFQGGWTAHAAPSDALAANATPRHGRRTNPLRVNNRARERGYRGRNAYATSWITASSSGGRSRLVVYLKDAGHPVAYPRPLSPCARPRFSFFPFFFLLARDHNAGASLSEVFGRLRDLH